MDPLACEIILSDLWGGIDSYLLVESGRIRDSNQEDIPLNLVDAYRQLKEPCKALAAHTRFQCKKTAIL